MSKFHNTHEAEELAIYAHGLGAGLAALSIALGVGSLIWHWKAVREHQAHQQQLEYEASTGIAAERCTR